MDNDNLSPTPAAGQTGSGVKKIQSRQLLSCTKCRERKVKCDRTKPCTSCCARGHPNECQFMVGEGNDYVPIQQSYEIRRLRSENEKMREVLRSNSLRVFEEDENRPPEELAEGRKEGASSGHTPKRRWKSDRNDSIYFGTPGLANVVSDFAKLQVGDSLSHPAPRVEDMFLLQWDEQNPPSHPFHVVVGWETIDTLVGCFPDRGEVLSCYDLFSQRAQPCLFPHAPDDITRKEIERFLDNVNGNATTSPDMLALLFMIMAVGLQMEQYDQASGDPGHIFDPETPSRSNAYMTMSMQALRIASFMSRPTLLAVQTLIMMGSYLTNSGRFLDAWTLFGTTVRLAQSMGMHRDPKILHPIPSPRDCAIRQTLWWWLLHLDQQYSITLGRPLGISGVGDCPCPEPLTANPVMLRLGQFVHYYTILARQILSSDGLNNVTKIDEFTDKLNNLWDTMPEKIRFNASWLQIPHDRPEWPTDVISVSFFLKIQSLLLVLNRKRHEKTESSSNRIPSRSSRQRTEGEPDVVIDRKPSPGTLRGRLLVVSCSASILKAFLFLFHERPETLVCWSTSQQSFTACMILILNARESGDEQNEWLIKQTYTVFLTLNNKGVHKLAKLAVQHIGHGLTRLEKQQNKSQDVQPQASTLSNILSSLDRPEHTDTVMGDTGMFLLDDRDPQNLQSQAFQAIGWNNTNTRLAARLVPSISVNTPFAGTMASENVVSPAQAPSLARLRSMNNRMRARASFTPQPIWDDQTMQNIDAPFAKAHMTMTMGRPTASQKPHWQYQPGVVPAQSERQATPWPRDSDHTQPLFGHFGNIKRPHDGGDAQTSARRARPWNLASRRG